MLTAATEFYAASYTTQPCRLTKNQSLKTLFSNISKTSIKPQEMDLLLCMIFKILIKNEEFEGDEYGDAEWEPQRIGRGTFYPTTRYTKLWNHFLTYGKIQTPHSDFTESTRKQMLFNFAMKVVVHGQKQGVNHPPKSVFICYGPGVDAIKKTCSKDTDFTKPWNCVLHLGHKHGIMYVSSIFIYI